MEKAVAAMGKVGDDWREWGYCWWALPGGICGAGMRICAFDLSLTGTGYSLFGEDGFIQHGLITTKGSTGMPRLVFIRDTVLNLSVAKANEPHPLVIMEDLAFSRNDPSAQERAGLAYLIRMAMFERGQRYLLCAPTTLKKYVTGKGNSPKQVMLLEVYKRWDVSLTDDNIADAFGLMQIGRALAGLIQTENKAQEEVLEVLRKKNDWLLSLSS